MRRILPERSWRAFFKKLIHGLEKDRVFMGAAALAFYFLLAIFPSLIILLSMLPFLPVPELEQEILRVIYQVLPENAAALLSGSVERVTSEKRGDLLSLGILGALWASSSGMYAIMRQLDVTYGVEEARPFWKTRMIAILLTILFAIFVLGGFSLVIFGSVIEGWVSPYLEAYSGLPTFFVVLRWVLVFLVSNICFSLIYYFGPDVEQRIFYVTPGSLIGTVLLAGASLLFSFYVRNFAHFGATYGGIGAVIILLLWLYIAGMVVLLGGKINAILEFQDPAGKVKGEKLLPHQRSSHGFWPGIKNWIRY